jgi:hypothetical protein
VCPGSLAEQGRTSSTDVFVSPSCQRRRSEWGRRGSRRVHIFLDEIVKMLKQSMKPNAPKPQRCAIYTRSRPSIILVSPSTRSMLSEKPARPISRGAWRLDARSRAVRRWVGFLTPRLWPTRPHPTVPLRVPGEAQRPLVTTALTKLCVHLDLLTRAKSGPEHLRVKEG